QQPDMRRILRVKVQREGSRAGSGKARFVGASSRFETCRLKLLNRGVKPGDGSRATDLDNGAIFRVEQIKLGASSAHLSFLPSMGMPRLTAMRLRLSHDSRFRPVHKPNQEPRSTKNSAVKLTRHRPVAGSKPSPFHATTWLKSPSIASRRAAATDRALLTDLA